LVTRICDWPYSSFHRGVRAGLFPVDWGGDAEMIGEFGER
jgi:putative transposase